MDMYTLLLFNMITNKDQLYGTCNSAQYYVTDVWEGRLGRMDTCICIVESLPCSPQTITTLFIGYTPIQNKKFKKKERKKKTSSKLLDVDLGNDVFNLMPKAKQQHTHIKHQQQTHKKLLQSKGNHQQNEKATH